ncbi:MAG: DUF4956 domain-containing protein [Eubacterium aggregans]|uniref:DUF4956 domain-containing protein n=1 Tax=Eubacterium aggregans TaxID=81409 RepID=UPI002B1FE6B3|nr:DUF4956 domain-containing protein [Eubacterium aggregans]MEA5073348.1 DUF4956 domain-containing protein [Eubacterium aggregans]
MFTSIINTTTGVTIGSALICTAAAVILGFLIALVHMKTGSYTRSFVLTLAVMPVLVQMVIMMASGNLGTSVAVLGTFSLVRFRSVPGSAREIASIFYAMAVGLAMGMGQVFFGVIMAIIVGVFIILLNLIPPAKSRSLEKRLTILIPENLDYTDIFDDVFQKYLKKVELQSVKTTNLGSMYELEYVVMLKNTAIEKEMIDAIRCRNGNLTVICGRGQTISTTL